MIGLVIYGLVLIIVALLLDKYKIDVIKIEIEKRVPDYCIMPIGYRLAWYNFETMTKVCYPIGLHWIVKIGYWIWWHTYSKQDKCPCCGRHYYAEVTKRQT